MPHRAPGRQETCVSLSVSTSRSLRTCLPVTHVGLSRNVCRAVAMVARSLKKRSYCILAKFVQPAGKFVLTARSVFSGWQLSNMVVYLIIMHDCSSKTFWLCFLRTSSCKGVIPDHYFSVKRFCAELQLMPSWMRWIKESCTTIIEVYDHSAYGIWFFSQSYDPFVLSLYHTERLNFI